MAKAKEVPEEKPVEIEASTEMDINAFQAMTYQYRTLDIAVPALAQYYPKGTKPVIKVRNLEGSEIAQIDLEVGLNREAREQITQMAADDVVNALKTIFHFVSGDGVPDTHVRALNIVHKGIVAPKMPFDLVVKLSKTHAIEFKILFNTITQLTGLGAEQGK